MKLRLVLLILAIQSCASAAIDFGHRAAHTPYDSSLQLVEQVLKRSGNTEPSMERTRELLRTAYTFRYEHTAPFRPQKPEITEKRRAGDCKDKSLWLCQQMADASVRFVVGRAQAKDDSNHAWLLWQKDDRWWILDPTNESRPIAAETLGAGEYIPLYSYTSAGRYTHLEKSGMQGIASDDRRVRQSASVTR